MVEQAAGASPAAPQADGPACAGEANSEAELECPTVWQEGWGDSHKAGGWDRQTGELQGSQGALIGVAATPSP